MRHLKKKQPNSGIGFSFLQGKKKARREETLSHNNTDTLFLLLSLQGLQGRQSYRLQKGRLWVLPAAWQGTAQGQDEQLKCWLSMFWRTHLPSLPFSKAAQYCHNWPCKILSYLSRGGGGTDLPRAPAVRTVNKITLFMCKHLSNSAHPVAQTQTSVTVQDQGIKTQTRKVKHLLILSLVTGIWLSLCCFWFKTLTLNSHTL